MDYELKDVIGAGRCPHIGLRLLRWYLGRSPNTRFWGTEPSIEGRKYTVENVLSHRELYCETSKNKCCRNAADNISPPLKLQWKGGISDAKDRGALAASTCWDMFPFQNPPITTQQLPDMCFPAALFPRCTFYSHTRAEGSHRTRIHTRAVDLSSGEAQSSWACSYIPERNFRICHVYPHSPGLGLLQFLQIAAIGCELHPWD